MDPEAAKFIGAGLAAMGAGLAGIGVGYVFGSHLQGAFRNPDAEPRISGRLFLGFAVVEALGLIAAVVSLYRSEEHTSELQALMRISYAVFCCIKKNPHH